MTVVDNSSRGNSEAGDGASETGLRGRLGVLALVLTVIAFNGPLIGLSGVIPFIISAGNGLAVPVTYLALGVVVLVFAVGLNAMAARMTHPGAFYTYVTAGIGRPAGLAAGFIAVVAYIGLPAGTYALFGTVTQHLLTDTFGLTTSIPWWVISLLAWAGVTTLSLFNIEVSAKVLGTASALEIALAVAWNFRVYLDGGPEGRSFDALSSFNTGSVSLALIFGVLCLTGFESLQVFRSETRDPNRTVPRATYISVIALVGIYSISAISYIIAYGPSNALTAGAEDPTGSVLSSMASYVAAPAADIANVLLVTSAFASCLGSQSVLTRYLFALGRDRVLSPRLGVASARHGSPFIAAVVAGSLTLTAFLIPTIGGAGEVLVFASLNGLGAYCLLVLWFFTAVSVVWFFRNDRRGASVWQVVVAPVVAAVMLAVIAVVGTIHFNDILGQSDHTLSTITLIGLAIVVAIGAGLAFWHRDRHPDTYRLIGNEAQTVDEV